MVEKDQSLGQAVQAEFVLRLETVSRNLGDLLRKN